MTIDHDYHVHSTYSDGSDMAAMTEAARAAGLDGVGFADHCNVSAAEPGTALPHDLDETYGERRREIGELRERFDLRVFDAVEMDYHPDDAGRIEAFLETAGFDYAVGSVHHVEQREVMAPGEFADAPEDDRRRFVDRYFDRLVELIRSELFDVVAHLDVAERNPHLRGFATVAHYRAVADAFAGSRSVPELNAGRVFAGYGEVHPHPELLEMLQAAGVPFVPGTDSHVPGEIGERAEHLAGVIEDRGIETVELA